MENLTPPPELVQQWCEQLFGCPDKPELAAYELARLGAQYGADQELEACCEWISKQDWTWTNSQLRTARRPKPLSLAEKALQALNEIEDRYAGPSNQEIAIRRALKRLQELEGAE